MTQVTAYAKYIRMSPRKVRLVVDAIKDLKPTESLSYLKQINKRAAQPIAKVVTSAIANAKQNLKLKEEDLKFSKILVEEGPTLKRWRPISRGRAHPINKRTSHIKVVLEAKDNAKAKEKLK